MPRTNFTQCHAQFEAGLNQSNATVMQWAYNGPTVGILPNNQSQITYQGCRELCGATPQFYNWGDASNTITTWILPIIGVLLQAPFESNKTWKTFEAIARWVGSPIASLSYTLWNVRVLGRCASMVDMSTLIDGPDRDQTQDFNDMRDSLFILGAMNQYIMTRFKREGNDPSEPKWGGPAAEGLLRIILFSKDLPLKSTCDCHQRHAVPKSLVAERRKIAHNLRVRRRRGIVPVFVSTMWFLFALALSIQSAFGQLGENAVAHDLALGLVLGWLPVLVLCSIVDRNPTDPDGNRADLNDLIRSSAVALLDDDIFWNYQRQLRKDFDLGAPSPDTYRGRNVSEGLREMRRLCLVLCRDDVDFFSGFAGQGRVRWHYGAAHPILSDIEDIYIAHMGRDWLRRENEARVNLVVGHVGIEKGLIWYDPREFWQISSAFLIVGGTCFGAFIISYNTPTVGLGCRSGGYMIFMVMSTILLTIELLAWWVEWAKVPSRLKSWVSMAGTCIRGRHQESTSTTAKYHHGDDWSQTGRETHPAYLKPSVTTNERLLSYNSSAGASGTSSPYAVDRPADAPAVGQALLRSDNFAVASAPVQGDIGWTESISFTDRLDCADILASDPDTYQIYEPLSFRKKLEYLLIVGEFLNTCWLIYIVVSQTFGIYKRCECLTSSWELGVKGYFDFTQNDITDTPGLLAYWVEGTVLGSVAMCAGLFYVVAEWALQSHMNTLNPKKAAEGLKKARRWRRWTYPVRWAIQAVIDLFDDVRGHVSQTRMRSMKWKPHPTARKRTQTMQGIIRERMRRDTTAMP
ncbi:hypothetical protein CAC42_10 [Sphaceloma murrayae]|uniref:Uncharacterized protein n=1 Tax=Sphaceloma murrayae TaxID=2082308 RepID=A0A2K1QSI7_9PEZI|nr:hypothetical protein CAC42_10 [Sphaceloma murrayae]